MKKNNIIVKRLLNDRGMTFPDQETREKYLYCCEELFSLAEDFNRLEYPTEATMLKDVFASIVKQLSADDEFNLTQHMESRGL